MKLDNLRGSVRPVITYAFAGTVLATGVYVIVKYADASMAQKILDFIIPTTTLIIGFWFGSRNK